jgi:predicted secreted protein
MSNDKKQTAVEWLFQETLGITLQLTNKRISHRNWELQMVKLHEQAKEMEKEQIEKAFNKGNKMGNSPFAASEWYYIATYGGNK